MNPFMLAVENVEVVKAMMKEDPDLMSLPVGSGTTVIHWALDEGHHQSAFFKVLCFVTLIIISFMSETVEPSNHLNNRHQSTARLWLAFLIKIQLYGMQPQLEHTLPFPPEIPPSSNGHVV